MAASLPLPSMAIMQAKAVRERAAENQQRLDQEAARSVPETNTPAWAGRGHRELVGGDQHVYVGREVWGEQQAWCRSRSASWGLA